MASDEGSRRSRLNDRQQRFVDEYLIDLNATQAAIRAGYSEKTAHSVGHENLRKPEIVAAIAAAQKKRSERTEIEQDRVLREIARLAFSDLRKAFTPGGSLLPPEDWDDDTAAAISSVEVVTRPTGEKDENGLTMVEHVHKLKTWDKNSALDKLMRHLGEYAPEKRQLSGPNGGPVRAEVDASEEAKALLSSVFGASEG